MIYVPESTFIHNYMKYMEDQECPRIYDFMTACWCLSNALGRHTIIDRPRAPVHLNMYVILVSESGIMRKSTSIRMATGIVRELFQRIDSKALLIETKATYGEICNELSLSSRRHNQAHMVFVASELAASFGRVGGVGNVIALLTDMYDCPDIKTGATIKDKITYSFNNVYSSFLAGSTPSWLERVVTPTIIEGGFTSRCYFVHGRQRKRSIAWPEGQQDGVGKKQLVDQLEELHAKSINHARINITASARDTFTGWYNGRILHRDTFRESFESREDSHILRFAGLFAANEDCWQIDDDHIRRAINIVADVKDAGTQLFTGVGKGVREADIKWIQRIRDTILAAGEAGIPRAILTRTMNPKGIRRAELMATLHTMHELDLIKVEDEHYEGMKGRPARIYKATEYLRNEQFLQDVVRKVGLDS